MKYPYLETYSPPAPILEVYFGYPGQSLSIGPVTALIDTGADGTLVPQSILDVLQAPLVDRMRIRSHWGEWRTVQVYTLDIGLGNLRLPVIEAVGDSGKEIILGRNVLNRLRLLVDGPNQQTTADE